MKSFKHGCSMRPEDVRVSTFCLREVNVSIVGWCSLLVLTLALFTGRAHAEGVGLSAAPVRGEPLRCYSPGDDMYCLMEGNTLVAVRGKRELLRLGTGQGFDVGQRVCDVGQGGDAACLYTESRQEGPKKKPVTRLRLVFARGPRTVILAEGLTNEGFGTSALGVYNRNGLEALAATVTEPKRPTRSLVSVNGQDYNPASLPSESLGNALAGATGERLQPALEFFEFRGALWLAGRSGTDLQVGKVEPGMTFTTAAENSMYDFRTVVGRDGVIYLFYHDYDEDAARVAWSRDGEKWSSLALDTEESGWQLDAAPAGYGVVATWYYMRNTYNKGLRTAFLRDGELLQPAHTLMRNGEHNAGWCPQLGVLDDGTTWVSWLDDVLKHERVWSKLGSPVDLADVRIRNFKDWRDHHKPWHLLAGGGGWYTLWNTFDLVPDKKDTGGVSVGKADRKLANTVLLAGLFEAQLWRVQLALGYAQSIIESADQKLGAGKLSSYVGSLKYDRLLPGHDVQVRAMLGHYTGTSRPAPNGDADDTGPLRIDTDYWHAQALALNKWRIKYGLAVSHYRLPGTVHTFSAAAGQTAYQYSGSFFRTIRFDDIRLLLGYTTLDYVARYENHYSGPSIGADALVGLSILKFHGVEPEGFHSVGKTYGVSFGAHVDAGWLWMQRLRALAGLGLYVRPLYRAEFDGVYGTFVPGDRKSDDAKKADVQAGASLLSVRHGPWLDIGLVW